MKVYPRPDVKDAYVVVSGANIYHCYLGPDPAYPRCDCNDAIYTDNPECRHVKFLKETQ